MEQLAIIHHSKSSEDFVLHLQKLIKYFDGKIFKKPANVSISHSDIYRGNGVAGFATKRWLFRVIGLPDDYIIWQKSKQLEILREREFGAIGCTAHEVRHRFQHYNPKSLISLSFVKQNPKYFPKGMIDHLYKNLYPLHSKNKEVFEREFDSSLIELLINCLYKNKKMTMDFILELIQCNESNIESILSKLD